MDDTYVCTSIWCKLGNMKKIGIVRKPWWDTEIYTINKISNKVCLLEFDLCKALKYNICLSRTIQMYKYQIFIKS